MIESRMRVVFKIELLHKYSSVCAANSHYAVMMHKRVIQLPRVREVLSLLESYRLGKFL